MSNSVLQFQQPPAEQYFRLKPAGQGDYETLKISGMSGHLPRENGLIQYERIGPFMPPMCIATSGDILVTEIMYRDLSSSEFSNFRVQPVIKAHICRSDRDGVAPVEPSVGEPEDEILEIPHDPDCAAALGDLYELILPIQGNWIELDYNTNWTTCEMVCPTFTSGHFFGLLPPSGDAVTPMCSTRFRRWLEDYGAAQWIRFIPATIHRS